MGGEGAVLAGGGLRMLLGEAGTLPPAGVGWCGVWEGRLCEALHEGNRAESCVANVSN